jgi:hypothetical protein
MTMTNDIQSAADLYRALGAALRGKTPDDVAREAAVSGSRLNLFRRALNRQEQAEKAATRLGFVGVGIISFADHRIATFCRRIGLYA